MPYILEIINRFPVFVTTSLNHSQSPQHTTYARKSKFATPVFARKSNLIYRIFARKSKLSHAPVTVPSLPLIRKTCRQSRQPLLRNSPFYSCVWGGTNRLIMKGVQSCKRACILYPFHIRLNSYLYCFSNTGIYSIGASTFTVQPPSNTSPVEVSFH